MTKTSAATPNQTILLLQGGGALGAYQGGVYEELAEAQTSVDWVAGISIGAVNAAIIAGNPPNQRVDIRRSLDHPMVPSRGADTQGMREFDPTRGQLG
jgi:predicted acylesterase/phospholipase RssA